VIVTPESKWFTFTPTSVVVTKVTSALSAQEQVTRLLRALRGRRGGIDPADVYYILGCFD